MTKPSDFGAGRGKMGSFGRGVQFRQLTPDSPVSYMDFSGGYNSSKGREGAPPNASPNTTDFEVNRKGQLTRMSGTTAPVTTVGYKPYQMMTQAGLNGVMELVLIAAPAVGHIKKGVLTWENVGLIDTARPFAFGQFGDILFFSNLTGPTFKREPGKTPVQAPTVPAAGSFATWDARFWAANTTIDGVLQPMGVRWTGTDADPENFDGLGSGNQLLIADFSDGEHAVSIRAMSLDLLAVVCSNSVWIGRRTGDTFQPAAFEPRTTGIGGLTDRTVAVTPLGLAFLSKDGLQIFDGNNLTMISGQVNAELLPLDMSKILQYRVSYNNAKNRIEILTPVCTWVFDIQFGRWYRSSIVATDAAFYVAEVAGRLWSGMTEQWSTLFSTSWADLDERVVDEVQRYYLKSNAPADSQYAVEDATSQTQFGLAMLPRWETSRQLGQQLRNLQTVKKLEIEYTGAGRVEFYLPALDGQLEIAKSADLVYGQRLRSRGFPIMHTGRGVHLGIWLRSGDVAISQIHLMAEGRSTAINVDQAAELPEPPQFFDPIAAGYTRTIIGRQGTSPVFLPVPTSSGEVVAKSVFENLTSAYIEFSLRFTTSVGGYYMVTEGAGFYSGDEPELTFYSVVFPFAIAASGVFALEYRNGLLRRWNEGIFALQIPIVAALPFGVTVESIGSENPDGGPTANKFTHHPQVTLYRRRDIEFQNLPVGSYVKVAPTGWPEVRVNAAADGSGLYQPPDGFAVAVPITYRFYDAADNLKATLVLPTSYFGDQISYVPQLDI